MDNSLLRLVRENVIAPETALAAAQDTAYMKRALTAPGVQTRMVMR